MASSYSKTIANLQSSCFGTPWRGLISRSGTTSRLCSTSAPELMFAMTARPPTSGTQSPLHGCCRAGMPSRAAGTIGSPSGTLRTSFISRRASFSSSISRRGRAQSRHQTNKGTSRPPCPAPLPFLKNSEPAAVTSPRSTSSSCSLRRGFCTCTQARGKPSHTSQKKARRRNGY